MMEYGDTVERDGVKGEVVDVETLSAVVLWEDGSACEVDRFDSTVRVVVPAAAHPWSVPALEEAVSEARHALAEAPCPCENYPKCKHGQVEAARQETLALARSDLRRAERRYEAATRRARHGLAA